MAGRVIDELVTIIRYNTSNRELRRAEQQVNDFTRNTQRQFASWGQNISKITRAATVVIGALGAGAFKVGAAEERSLLNLRTQLGLTADEVEELKAPLRDLSKETNRSLKEVNDAMFSVKSAGLETADALVVMDQSAKAAASGLGETKPIALLASGAVYSYGAAVLDGKRAVEILLATVKAGNLDAAQLATTFGRTFEFAAKLGVGVDEVGTAIAGYTRGGQNASQATDAVRMALTALLAPSTEAEKILNGVGLSVADVHRNIREEGFIQTIRMLSDELEGDTTQLRRLFGDVNAVGFALSASGPKFQDYMDIQADIRASTNSVNEAFEIYANSSVADADRATNNLRLALSTLYNNVLAPLLQLFGKLPSAIQTVVLGMGAMQIASTIGLGPSIGGLVGSLGRFIVALKTGAIWNSNFILSLRLAAISAGKYVASLKIAAVATKVFRGVMLLTGGAARAMWLAITGPVGLVIGAFALVGFVVYKFRRQILGALKAVWSWIKGNWPLLVGILLGPFGIVGALVWKFRDQILGAFREVWDWLRESPIFSPVIDGIQAIIDFVRELPGRVVGILKDIPGMVADAIRDVPGLGAALEVFTGIAGKVKERFDKGGIVPGPLGRPLLATVHGGEMVLPVGASRVIAQMLEGFRLGPAALPQAPHYYGQMYRSLVTNRTVNINITEPIVIQTQATDAKGIAQELREEIQDQVSNIAFDHDGPVER